MFYFMLCSVFMVLPLCYLSFPILCLQPFLVNSCPPLFAAPLFMRSAIALSMHIPWYEYFTWPTCLSVYCWPELYIPMLSLHYPNTIFALKSVILIFGCGNISVQVYHIRSNFRWTFFFFFFFFYFF